jgi:hypothetical protein
MSPDPVWRRPLGPVGVAQSSARGGARSSVPDVHGMALPDFFYEVSYV